MGDVSKFDLTLSLCERLGPGKEPTGIEGLLEYTHRPFRYRDGQLHGRAVHRDCWHRRRPDPDERAAPSLRARTPPSGRSYWRASTPTACPVPERSVPELFESWVARNPEAVALISGTVSLSYGELNTQANRLAHHLISLGVGPETLVGICIDRSVAMVAALLAILKAGAAYVPIAPDLPAIRRDALVSDSGLRHMVTSSGLS